jgi:hypothetical protein
MKTGDLENESVTEKLLAKGIDEELVDQHYRLASMRIKNYMVLLQLSPPADAEQRNSSYEPEK